MSSLPSGRVFSDGRIEDAPDRSGIRKKNRFGTGVRWAHRMFVSKLKNSKKVLLEFWKKMSEIRHNVFFFPNHFLSWLVNQPQRTGGLPHPRGGGLISQIVLGSEFGIVACGSRCKLVSWSMFGVGFLIRQ